MPEAPECLVAFVCPACTHEATLDAHRGAARCYGPDVAPHPPVFMVPARLA